MVSCSEILLSESWTYWSNWCIFVMIYFLSAPLERIEVCIIKNNICQFIISKEKKRKGIYDGIRDEHCRLTARRSGWGQGLSVWSLQVLQVLVWVSSGCSGFPPPSKHICYINSPLKFCPWPKHWLRSGVGPQVLHGGCPQPLRAGLNAGNLFHNNGLGLIICDKWSRFFFI